MEEKEFERWEGHVREWAGGFHYPPAPNIVAGQHFTTSAGQNRRRAGFKRTALAAGLILLFLIVGSLSVPAVRAAVLEFLQLGAVRIILPQPAASPTPTSPEDNAPAAATTYGLTATSTSTAVDLTSLRDLDGETTLAEARQRTGLPIRLPGYPADLGLPDHVFVQEMDGWVVILVWDVPGHPQEAELSLHMISEGSFAVEKVRPQVVEETTVNGEPALWTSGPYIIRLLNRDFTLSRLVNGNGLIWVEQGITYRLESDLQLEEAVRIAESLK